MTSIEDPLRSFRIRHDPGTLSKVKIPVDPGVYAWSFKFHPDTVVYVGKASASLPKRIWNHPLRSGYVETTSVKFQPQDAPQLQKARVAGRAYVEKSVLRRAIARQCDLAPGEATAGSNPSANRAQSDKIHIGPRHGSKSALGTDLLDQERH